MSRIFDAVLFDLDGTLTDSAEGIFEGLRYTCAFYGVDVSNRDLTPYLGPPLRVIYRSLIPEIVDESEQKMQEAISLYRTYYLQKGIHNNRAMPGAPEMLHRLKDNGLVLCTATCKQVIQAEIVLKEQGMADCIAVVGGADEDAGIETKQQVILSVLQNPALQDKRVLMVGDRIDDVQGAHDCGIPAAMCSFGYASPGEAEKARPEFTFDTWDELIQYVLGN